jgi:hypothetical protein
MKFILLIFTLILYSCGFERIERQDKIKNVSVIINKMDENSATIKKILEDKFETSFSPKYKITIEKTESIESSGLGADALTSNFTITIQVNFKLIEIDGEKVIFTGRASSSINYISARQNVIADFFTQKSAGENASINLANQIYEDIQNRFGF